MLQAILPQYYLIYTIYIETALDLKFNAEKNIHKFEITRELRHPSVGKKMNWYQQRNEKKNDISEMS